jgi:spermidine synthase
MRIRHRSERMANAPARQAAAGESPRTRTQGQSARALDGARFHGLLVLLFAVSGCSALIYEIVWFQLLELVVGSSAISLGILLAVYMGGMCLGSLLLARVARDRWHPLRVYALLELGIGLLALIALFEVPLIGSLYTGAGAHGLWSIVLRATIAGFCLLPPTILMGATLPGVSRWVESTPRGMGWVGFLYGANVTGAVVGCLLAGFYLLRVHDMATATFVAVLLNVLVGVVALLLAGRKPQRAGTPAPAADSRAARGVWTVLVVTALSGLTALGAEVVWTRLLSLLLGATVYTFSIILAVFLFGMAIGSSLGAARARSSTDPARDLGLVQLALAATVAWAAFMLCASLPYWPVSAGLSRSPWILFQLDIVRCLWAILPAALLWGASFPLALAGAASRGQDPGRVVAGVYVANTLGAIVGSLGFTFWIIPQFGVQAAGQVLIGLAAAAGLLLLVQAAWSPGTPRRYALPATAGLVVVVVLALRLVGGVPPLPGGLVAFGRSLAFRLGAADARTNAAVPLPEILYVGQGMSEFVAVSDDGRSRLFSVSGKIEASTSLKDMRLQRMLGHLPAVLHSRPRSVLIVGFGSGATSGAFTLYPEMERIVICEIEPLIPRVVSRYFADANYNVVSDPRVRIVYDDARHFMLTTREKFDLITSDPIHPWVKGSAALYSREYFDLVRKHLSPGGLVTQWLPLYQSSEATVRGEIATFFSAFPGGSVWANNAQGQGYDVVLLGGDAATRIDLDALDARLKRPDYAPVARSLQEVGFLSWSDLLSTYLGREQDLKPWLAGAAINRDRKMWLQYQAGLETLDAHEAEIHDRMSAYRRFPEDLFAGSEPLKAVLRDGGAE